MKSLNYALAVIGATLAVVGTGLAQGPGGPPPGGGPGGPGGGMRKMMRQMEDSMFAKLNLTPDQKKKIEALRKERDAKMAKLTSGMRPPAGGPPAGGPPPGGPGGPPPGGGRGGGMRGNPAMRAVNKEYRDKLDTILTVAQKAKLKTLREEMRAKFGGGRGPGGPGGPGRGPGG